MIGIMQTGILHFCTGGVRIARADWIVPPDLMLPMRNGPKALKSANHEAAGIATETRQPIASQAGNRNGKITAVIRVSLTQDPPKLFYFGTVWTSIAQFGAGVIFIIAALDATGRVAD
jgi:hypothetical protein